MDRGFVEIPTAVFDMPRPDRRWRVRAPGWLLDADAVRHPSWRDAERARRELLREYPHVKSARVVRVGATGTCSGC